VWNARGIQELLDFRAGEGKKSHELRWVEECRREPARVITGSRRRAAASASSSPAAAGAAAAAGACAALSRAGAATASSITASAAATPAATATLSVEVGVVRDQVSVETCRLRRNRARAGVDAAESKNEGPRRRR
jgi:pyruvate/2-oxoglutarate dehydrogenase complex dihydrolipoamide acyltransferase (E2) component